MVDKWTSEQVDKLLAAITTANSSKHTLQWTSVLVYELTGCLHR